VAIPSKTADRTLISHQVVTHPVTIVGTELDVSTIFRLGISFFHGFIEAAANTNPGIFIVQVNASASNDDKWEDLYSFSVNDGTPDDEALTATEPVDETSLAVSSTTGFVAEDEVYIHDVDNAVTNSEWNKIQEIVTNTSIEILDGLRVEKPSSGSGSIIYNDAFKLPIKVDVSEWTRLRIVYMHEGATGADGHILVLATSFDSIG
jgi:hypothetical protein